MGFSQQTKDELSKLIPRSRCCMVAELAALVELDGRIVGRPEKALDITLSNAAAAKKVLILMKELFHPQIKLKVRKQVRLQKGHVYTLTLPPQRRLDGILRLLGVTGKKDVGKHSCCRRAFVRGAFLGRGSITDPEKNYHLEFSVEQRSHALRLLRYIRGMGLAPKLSHRKGMQVVYLKEADKISGLLSILGAHSALLTLENVRVVKGMRNSVNRLVNCETANVDKTVKAAVKQKEMIERVFTEIGPDKLPPDLLEVARLRIENPYATLKELGQMMEPPLGKSGINHRMRKLRRLARQLDSDRREAGE